MKHLDKFYNYITESNKTLDISEIKMHLLPISDMGIEVIYHDYVEINKEGSDVFLESIKISFKITHVDYVIRDKFTSRKLQVIDDDVFWEFLDEMISFKDRLGDFGINFLINFFNNDRGFIFTLYLLGDKVEKDDNLRALTIIYNKLYSMLNGSRTDYAYDTMCELKDGNITIYTGNYSYTDRKFNSLIKRSGVDRTKINIEKSEGNGNTYNRITIK